MFKILLAETDPTTVDLVNKLIDEKIKGAKVIAVAASGNNAIVDTINNEPDLIIVSIEIAGMNGIETIKKIRRFNKSARIIIISAYDYFEFAKEAMILGVNDYVLKPVNESELLKAIERELQAIREENEREREYKNEENQFANALRFVEQHLIYSISYNMKLESDMESYHRLLGIETTGYMMSVAIEPAFLNRNWNMEKASGRIYRRLRDIVNMYSSCAIGPRILNRYTLYISCNKERDSKEAQIEAIKLGKAIVRGIKDTFDLEVKVAIGGIQPFSNIYASYLEMLRSCRHDIDSSVVYYKEVRHKSGTREACLEMTDQLIERIKYDRQNGEECFANIIDLIRPLEATERLTMLIEVLMSVSYAFRKELKGQEMSYDYVKQCDSLIHLSVEEQELWAYRRLHTMVKLMKASKNTRKSSVITVAMEYIQKHYNEDISLNEISKYVNLSPQHFSKTFKEVTNFNYVEWVNNLRITKAKEIMNQEDYTIGEVGTMVGFPNANYFSRIFKKYVGISPTEYIKEREK